MIDTLPTEKMNQPLDPIPRIALLISDATVNMEIEQILRKHYSSLLLITERSKLEEFDLPLIVLVDTIQDVALVREADTAEGTKVLMIANALDGEITSAAFTAGADDCLAYPFAGGDLIDTLEKYLELFR